jgi:hypothetical protein
MKFAVLIAILFTIALPAANAGLSSAGRDAAGDTEADANVVRACFGGCEKDNNQLDLTTSPYEVDQKYNEIMKGRGVVTPQELQNGKGKKEGLDI